MKPSVQYQPNGALCHRCLQTLPEDQREPESYAEVRDRVNLAIHSVYGDLVCIQCMLPHEKKRFNVTTITPHERETQ